MNPAHEVDLRVARSGSNAYQFSDSRLLFATGFIGPMTQDLKLLAMDAEDLTVVSAHLQDAVLRVEDLVFSGGDGKLVLGLNRFAWETRPVRRLLSKQYERRRSILQIDRVAKLRSKGFDRNDKDTVLSVLTISFHTRNADDPKGMITITFSGDTSLQAEVECIEVRLSDQGGAWAASGRPRHGV